MKKPKINYQKTIENLLAKIPKRNRDVLRRRFGFRKNIPETLESIGESYKITRERVRQIEEAAISQIKNQPEAQNLQENFRELGEYLNYYGGLKKESDLFAELAKSPAFYPHLRMFLRLAGSSGRCLEDDRFHCFWSAGREPQERLQRTIGTLVQKLEEHQKPLAPKEFQRICQNDLPLLLGQAIPEPAFKTYLACSKEICRGPFGHFGLYHWPEINPRSVRDRAYLIFKRGGKPLHFKQVANLINKANFPQVVFASYQKKKSPKIFKPKLANTQTVHNELIKDDRFVLIGRGIYALKEWGFRPGIVKEIIAETLDKSPDPLTKKEIVKKVLEQRKVKENTILLNLQDKNLFQKLEDGRYVLTPPT